MRILLINQTFHPDTAATAQYAYDLARDLVGRGHEVAVVASRSLYGQRGAVLPRHELIEGIEVHRVGVNLFDKGSIAVRAVDFGLFYVLAGARAMTLRRADVVVTLTTPPMLGLLGCGLKWTRRSRLVSWLMDLYPEVLTACGVMGERGLAARGLRVLNKLCLHQADRTVVLGECVGRRLRAQGVPAERIVHLPLWADDAELTPPPREANPFRRQWGLDGKVVVMYAGNLGMGHDMRTIGEAADRLRGREDVVFVFVGGGRRKEELVRFVSERGLRNVQFHEPQPREHLAALLGAGDVHLVSLIEPMAGVIVPSKTLGVLGAGRPAVFVGPGECEAARFVAEHGAGVVVPNGDAAQLASALTALADDPARRSAMGEAGRAAVAAHRQRAAICGQWAALLEEVAGG